MTLSSEDDRAMAAGIVYRKFGNVSTDGIYRQTDKHVEKQCKTKANNQFVYF